MQTSARERPRLFSAFDALHEADLAAHYEFVIELNGI